MAVLVSAAGFAAAANAQSADEIVAANVAARGGLEAWRAVQSLRISGKMDIGKGLQAPFSLQLKRPRSMRLEFLFDGEMVVQAYDGRTGWKRQPHLGRGGYELLSRQELEGAAGQAELDGPLVDYRAKGHKIAVVGEEMVEGRRAHKLAITLASGALRHVYVDAETHLEVKADSTRMLRGKQVRVETFFRDYRSIDGRVLPHTLETKTEGAPASQKLLVERVEVNPLLAEALFKPPSS